MCKHCDKSGINLEHFIIHEITIETFKFTNIIQPQKTNTNTYTKHICPVPLHLNSHIYPTGWVVGTSGATKI